MEKISLDPTAQTFLNTVAANDGPPLYKLPIPNARAVLTGLQSGTVAKPAADIDDRVIPVGPKGRVQIRIIRPQESKGILPAVMYFHGGGWVLGDKDTHDRLVRELAIGAKAAVVFVDYSRSPEERHPIAMEECYAASQWVIEHAKELNIDPTKIAVAGDSAGGHLAAGVTLLSKERGGPKFAAQILFYPVTDADFDTLSYRQFADGYFLTRAAMKWFWDCYQPDTAARELPQVSPLHASLEQLRGLPPALVITGECDVLRDEGEAYAHKLLDAGVAVTAVRHLGITHDFVMLNALSSTPAARAAVKQAVEMLQKAFAK